MPLEAAEFFQNHNLYIPTRTIYLGTYHMMDTGGDMVENGVDAKLAENVIKNLHILESLSAEPITIILNCIGGDEQAGLSIYDALRASPCDVFIKVFGSADSSASIILQAGDKRSISPNSRMLLHYGSIEVSGESETAMNWLREEKRSRSLTVQIFYDIIKKKVKNITKNAVHKMLNKDTILTARQALRLGLVDEIL